MNSTFSADRSATAAPPPRHDHDVRVLHMKAISPMRPHRIALGAVLAAALAVTGCGATKDQGSTDSTASATGGGAPASGLQYMVPNAPGGGYDTTARAAAQVMEKEGITETVQVFNLPGRRWHRRPPARRQREGQRQARHADGPRRRRRGLHAEVEGLAERHHSDRQAHRGGRARSSCPRTPRTPTSTSSSRRGRRTRSPSPSAAGPRPAARTTSCRCSWPRPSASTRRPSATCRTTAAASCSRRCSATRSPSAPPASVSSSTRSRPATSASSP